MRRLLTILLLFVSFALFGNTYFVSTTGNNGNLGTLASPWATWQYGFDNVHIGDTLFIRGGTYNITSAVYQSGEVGSNTDWIVISAYGTEVPILNCSGVSGSPRRGLYLSNCDYWQLIGLTVQNVPDALGYPANAAYGFYIENSDYITYTRCTARWNQGPGYAINGYCDYSRYYYCDSYSNYDDATEGEHADGFIASHYNSGSTPYSGYHTQYYYCRAWNNSDDGYDRLTSENTERNYGGYFIWDHCWSFANGYGNKGDGWGFKLESANGHEPGYPLQQTLRNSLSFNNKWGGVSVNEGGRVTTHVYNNTIWANGAQGIYSDGDEAVHTFRNNITYENGSTAYVDQSNFVHDHNTFDGISVDDDDFVSLDSAGTSGARGSDGSLPVLNFLKLAEGSNLIDAGYDVQLLYEGVAPDLGAYEYGFIAPVTVPTVTTTAITSIGTSTATTGGNVTDNGGASVTARGICYSTAPSPTITSLKTTDGSGDGAFESNLTGLALATTYYVRAYATNSAGTGYGNQRIFTTGGSVPTGGLIKFTR